MSKVVPRLCKWHLVSLHCCLISLIHVVCGWRECNVTRSNANTTLDTPFSSALYSTCSPVLSCRLRFNLPDPIYINLVRDPVERVISWYYYVRAPWYFVERKRAFPDLPLPNPNWLRKVSEDCSISQCECPVIVQSRA